MRIRIQNNDLYKRHCLKYAFMISSYKLPFYDEFSVLAMFLLYRYLADFTLLNPVPHSDCEFGSSKPIESGSETLIRIKKIMF
jgi:hypothetical protein